MAAAPVGRRRLAHRSTLRAYLFLAPALFFVLVQFILPFGYNIVVSLHQWSLIRNRRIFVGFENYVEVLTSERLWLVFRNTSLFAAMSVPIGVLLSLIVALGFNALLIQRGSGLLRALYFAPVVASLTAVAFIWKWIFNPTYGLANAVLNALGLPGMSWLTSQTEVLPSLAIMYIWARLGFNAVILLAGLKAIDRSYYEAARIDGASWWQMLTRITIPLLNRQLVLVLSVEVMNAFKIFELPFAATKGGPAGGSRTFIMEVHENAFKFDLWGTSAVYVIIVFTIIMIATGIIRKVFTRDISEA